MNWHNKISKDTRVVVLTGAGISAESGIKTFRDQNGLWENHDIMEVASAMGFERDPELVYRFYNLRRAQLKEVSPNPGHFALAEMEEMFPNFTLITQNVDDLHERAGSKNVVHMHGELKKMRCVRTKKVYSIEGDLTSSNICPCCHEEGLLRPHIVWFGEVPLFMDKITNALENCDLFIAIGTSGVVYPAAYFVTIAKTTSRAITIEFNTQMTEVSEQFDEKITGPSGVCLPDLVSTLKSKL